MPARRRGPNRARATMDSLAGVLKETLRLTDDELADPDTFRARLRERLQNRSDSVSELSTRSANQANTQSVSQNGVAERVKFPLPEYYGFRDSRTPKDFLEELRRYGKAQGLTNDQLLQRIVPAALKGVAARWWTFMDGFVSWGAFEESLQAEYGPPDYRDALLLELESRTQHPDEPLSAFIQAIAGYYERIGGEHSEEQRVERVLKQMHPELRRIVGDEKFSSLKEFSAAAPRYQRVLVRERDYRPPPPACRSIEPTLAWPYQGVEARTADALSSTHGNDDTAYLEHGLTPRLTMAALDPYRYNRYTTRFASGSYSGVAESGDRGEKYNRKRAIGNYEGIERKRVKRQGEEAVKVDRACWGCGVKGHLPRCDSQADCRAGNEVKVQERSPAVKREQAEACGVKNIRNAATQCMLLENDREANPKDPPLVKTRVEGYYYLALIDTGASTSFLGDTVIQRLVERKIEITPSNVDVELASGRIRSGGEVNLEISWSGGRLTQRFVLLPGSQCAIILGRDFIIAAKISINLSRGGWTKTNDTEDIRPFDNTKPHAVFKAQQNYEADVVEAILEREAPIQATSEIREVLRKHERVFSSKPGRTRLVQHRINTGHHPPVRCRMRPLNSTKRSLLEQEVQKLLADDIIEECSSVWASPPVLVAKKNGGVRVCVDLRAVNKISVVVPYVMPTADWIFAQLGHAQYFSSIDIAQGYHQISLYKGDRDKSSFIVGNKQYRYKRLPFGLAGSDMNKPFIIQCDASREGLGATLMQVDDDKRRRPVAFASRLLAPRESRYNISELECLAVVWATSKFSHYVEMSEFTVETDHAALRNILTIDEPTGRIRRWAMRLMGQRCIITYRKGSHMRAADALSRAATEGEDETSKRLVDNILPLGESEGENKMKFSIVEAETQTIKDASSDATIETVALAVCRDSDCDETFIDIGSREMWRDAQDQDATIRELKREAERDANEVEKGRETATKYVVEKDGVLVRYLPRYTATRNGDADDHAFKIVVPAKMRSDVMRAYHNHVLSSHLGVRKSLTRVQRYFTWTGMGKDIRAYITGCVKCQTVKPRRQRKSGFMDSRIATKPGESVSCDVIGPLPMTSDRKRFIFVVIDDFTKFVELYPLGTSTGPKITHCLIDYCCRYGFMTSLRSDGGRQFGCKLYNAMCEALKIKPRRITPYRPQGNSCEIANKAIKTCIKMYAKYHKDWSKHLSEIAFALRSARHTSTGLTPAMLLFGREMTAPWETELGRVREVTSYRGYAEELIERLTGAAEIARCNLQRARASAKEKYDAKRRGENFDIGDLVWRDVHCLSDKAKGVAASLMPKRDGPYKITEKIGENVYRLVDAATEKMAGLCNVDQLTRFHSPPNWA
ncbi:hypothetical protein B566_EDAN009925 [Ephemera danica]|nr:hypothetical protein B566_EDAN009925 [Ephemera danica]